jgi:hypothetical protein
MYGIATATPSAAAPRRRNFLREISRIEILQLIPNSHPDAAGFTPAGKMMLPGIAHLRKKLRFTARVCRFSGKSISSRHAEPKAKHLGCE